MHMKNFAILIFGLFLFSYPVLAQVNSNYLNSSGNTQQSKYDDETNYDTASDTQDSDDFYNELIEQNYGSDESPAFNNNAEMNPNEANYGYDGGGAK